MSQVERKVRVTTTQEILKDLPEAAEGFPMRRWTISIGVVGQDGNEVPGYVFDKVTYKLHPTFANPNRSFKKPPFKIEEQGWGEFDIVITLTLADKAGERVLYHDLNFQQNKYVVDHEVSFPTNKPNLAKLLAASGPVPGLNGPGASGISSLDAGAPLGTPGEKRKFEEGQVSNKSKKKSRVVEKGSIDLERLADGLQKLSEDDLLGVVQMITDNKTQDMYIKNDVDEGEFHIDLYTVPDSLLRSLWEYVKKRVDV